MGVPANRVNLLPVARVKGLTFADMKTFVRERAGEQGWDRLRAELPAADRAVLDEVVAIGWYPLGVHMRALAAMPTVLGEPMPRVMREYARYAAEVHVSRVYRVLFLVANPALMLEKSGEYWSRFYDTGEWRVTRESPTRARGDLVNFAQPDAHLCEFLLGYLPAIFERVGAKEVRCQHVRCRVKGDSACSYQLEWR